MPSNSWANDWATGDIPTAAEFRKGMGCVADSTLGASAASVDFTGIPVTYAHLRIVAYLRGDLAATLTQAQLRFNNDSAANYDSQYLLAQGAASAATEAFAASTLYVGDATASTAGANLFSQHVIDIVNYAGSANNKVITWQSAVKIGTSTTNLYSHTGVGFWRSNAAISRVTFLPGSGNFVSGSRVSVYVAGS